MFFGWYCYYYYCLVWVFGLSVRCCCFFFLSCLFLWRCVFLSVANCFCALFVDTHTEEERETERERMRVNLAAKELFCSCTTACVSIHVWYLILNKWFNDWVASRKWSFHLKLCLHSHNLSAWNIYSTISTTKQTVYIYNKFLFTGHLIVEFIAFAHLTEWEMHIWA